VARTLRVRPATADDIPALMAFADELREALLPAASDAGGRPRGAPAAARALLEARYLEALADPGRHLVVVVNDAEEPLGTALLTIASANALLDLPAVHMSHAVVSDRHKRRGAGKALVAAAAAFAESHGLEQIVVSVHPGSRDANRFFARLGFAPLAVRRVAPVSVVRRRLAQVEARPADHVVRRRPRRAVRRPHASGVPLGPAEPDVAPSP
jgi:ribosomal protein S18 acetylase RimI-like enzyme